MLCLGLLFFLALGTVLNAQSISEVRRDFMQPPKSVRSMVRWWWPGGDVTSEELRREVAQLDEAGFGGAEIQPFRIGLKADMPADVLARVNDYPTQSFFQKVRAAIEEARSRGLFLDLTLGSGWPFGGGEAITPELASIELRSTHQNVQGPGIFKQKLEMPPGAPGFGAILAKMTGASMELPSGWQQRMKARTRIVAVVAVRGSAPAVEQTAGRGPVQAPRTVVKTPGQLDPASAIVLTEKVQSDGTLEWNVPAGQWQLFLFMQQPADMRVLGGVGGGPQLVMDHMSRAALDAHLARIMGPALSTIGDLSGAGLRAVFCDSLEVTAENFWSDNFVQDFRKRRGYDLIPWLPFLKTPGYAEPYGAWQSPPLFDGPGAAKVRRDYWQTVSDVWIDNFFQPIVEWAHIHKVKARIQAHGAPVDVERAYSLADIPETEQLYAGGRMDFLKAASSSASLSGRKIVSAESFVHFGQAYQTTVASLERDTNTLIAAGVNQIIYHGFPYIYMDRPEPGWFPFSAPVSFSDHFNPKTKIWQEVPGMNAYISRLQLISQTGERLARYAWLRAELDYPNETTGPMLPTRDFDHVSEAVLAHSRVKNGHLVTPNGRHYEALVVPSEEAGMRRRFPGLKIIAGAPPADDSPTRWKLAGIEFQFYFNDSGQEKRIALPPGHYEKWDAWSGQVSGYGQSEVTLAPDKALLLSRAE